MADAYLVGRHAVVEALKGSRRVRRLLVAGARGQAAHSEAIALAERHGVPLRIVSKKILDDIGPHHQNIAAEIEPFPYVEVDELTGGTPLLVVLDSVQDPQNFGTLLRTAAAVGATGAIIPKHRAVDVTPAVERASAGAVSRLAIARATNLPRALDALRAAGVWIYGIDARAGERYDQVDLTGAAAIVVGSEGEGLGRLVREKCDRLLRVPMAGGTESLNVAIAGSIVLAEVFRQRERAGQVAEGPLPAARQVPARPERSAPIEPVVEDSEDSEEPTRPFRRTTGTPSRAPRQRPSTHGSGPVPPAGRAGSYRPAPPRSKDAQSESTRTNATNRGDLETGRSKPAGARPGRARPSGAKPGPAGNRPRGGRPKGPSRRPRR